MYRRFLRGSLIVLLIAAAFPAGASGNGSIEDRISEQQHMIRLQLSAGQITEQEADILHFNLNRIASRSAKLKSAGTLSERELFKLNVLLDHNSDMLARKRVYGVKKLF